ncbi:MAG: ribosome silencing factor [Bacteroidia bacterium]|nr:ribosome silencing factor [Bacteroidia bacterium]MDW8334595.1 ribosome silencing factor [Bacteroidia bacterium]
MVIETAVQTTSQEKLVEAIVAGLREKKGFDFAILDLSALKGAVADRFVIASASSDRQAQALADSVEEFTRKHCDEKPLRVEGYARGEWILLDYVNVVVHIFLPRVRQFYALEDLWADAPLQRIAQ